MFSLIKKCIPKETRIWLSGWKQYFKNRVLLKQTQKHYRELEKSVLNKKNLIVASYVVFDSTFGAYSLMEYWMADERYSPKIVIIPDVSRGKEAMIKQYKLTKAFFVNKYGAEYVIDGYDIELDTYLDPSDSIDIAYMANPYDGMVNPVHSITYLSTRNVLPFVISYCYLVGYYGLQHVVQSLEVSLCWKVFTETRYAFKAHMKYQMIHGKNAVLSGYPKMDAFNNSERPVSKGKTIILAPHHTTTSSEFPFSNFHVYYELILELPDKYPDVHFVFRPHPLLFPNLVKDGFWTQEQVDDYLSKLQMKGIEYSFGGDYMSLFKRSDALIHDCGSFMVEYLFTGNPCCFVSKKDNARYLNAFGKKCLNQHYRAWSEKDITSFIDDIVSDKRQQTEMPAWFRKDVAVHYPNASQFIYEHLCNPVK